MSHPIIEVQNLSKLYELGTIGGRTLRESLERRWYRMRGKEHLLHKIGAKHQTVGPDHPQAGPRPNTMWALKDVSFTVREGEVLGIIGRNGAGKSTLLKLLTRITEPTSGRALVYGRVASLLEVGTGFHPELTGRENVYLSGAVLGMKKAEVDRKFDEIVAFSEIGQYLDTPVKRYSSGMYVRLAFAVAAHLEPEILIVDEVLAVGDAAFQKKCLGKMGDVAGEGRTVLFVSHNMAAIQKLCGKAVLIQDGSLYAAGQTDEVIGAYLSAGKLSAPEFSKDFSRPQDRSTWLEKGTILVNDVPSPEMKYGDQLSIKLQFSSSIGVDKPSVGLLISSLRGGALLNSNNLFLPSSGSSTSIREGAIKCDMGVLPLMEGQYAVSIWFGEREKADHQYFEDALHFDVVEADPWGTGRLPTKKLSSLWWPTRFSQDSLGTFNEIDIPG